MKQFFSFVLKETKHITRDKRTMLMLFGMPIVMMLLFGFAVTNDVRNVRVVIVMSNADNATQQVADRLAASEYFTLTKVVATPTEAEKAIRDQKADMAIVFSPDFASRKSGYQLIVDGADPNMAQQWTTYANAVINNTEAKAVNTKLLYNPRMKSTYNFVPAIMGTLLMLVCAMMTSISIVREKEKGTMEVLLVSPTKPLMIIVAKLVPYLVLAFTILSIILLMSSFVLGVPIKGSLFWIYVVSTISPIVRNPCVNNSRDTTRCPPHISDVINDACHYALWNDVPNRVNAEDITIHLSHYPYSILHQCDA